MKFRLSEEDAERLGCRRDVEFDSNKLMGREAIMLDRMGWPLERLGELAAGRPVLNADGSQRFEVDDAGNQVLVDGKPKALYVLNPEAVLVMIWMAVRRATERDIPWDTFDVDLIGAMESLDESPGKAPANRAEKRASARATKSTKPRSRTTSTSRRGTSTTG